MRAKDKRTASENIRCWCLIFQEKTQKNLIIPTKPQNIVHVLKDSNYHFLTRDEWKITEGLLKWWWRSVLCSSFAGFLLWRHSVCWVSTVFRRSKATHCMLYRRSWSFLTVLLILLYTSSSVTDSDDISKSLFVAWEHHLRVKCIPPPKEKIREAYNQYRFDLSP